MSTLTNGFNAAVHQEEDTAVIKLNGVINNTADPALEDAYQKAEALAAPRITLDFTAVEYINSTGIALIVSLLAHARAHKTPITAVGLTDHYREIFTITRLSDFMDIQ
ncbi:MAG: STAS domain-containing protein [Anaerolineales bacterium]|nr:STAS domain-containing protein [Anaerolineales bacterium]